METQNKYHLLCTLVLLIKLMICPERVTSSSLKIKVKVGNVYKYITLNDDEFLEFKACACDPNNTKGCYTSIRKVYTFPHTDSGDRITQFSQGQTGTRYTYFACKYSILEGIPDGIECAIKHSDDCICDSTNKCNALLDLKCQDNLSVFLTWDSTQDAWVYDYNTTEINLINCCSSTTQRSTCSNQDAPTTTPERGKTTAISTATKIVTTTSKPTTTSVSKQATTTTISKTDPKFVTSSHILTTFYDNLTTQNQHENHTEEVAEFSPAYFGLLIGVCVASATVSVLITSFVMIKWHQRQEKSLNEPNRSHQERQNETVSANNIANHPEGNAMEMTETNTSHVANAQGISERSTGHGNIPHSNNNNPLSSSLQYIVSGNYSEVDLPSAGPVKVPRNDAYAEVKKVSIKNPVDTNNVNTTEDNTYSRLHATRRDIQNLYDILPHEGDDGHGGISSPYSEVAVPKPGTVLSIL